MEYVLDAPGMSLEVYRDKLAIVPKGALGFFAKGTTARKEIPYQSINAIEFKEGGFTTGYLQFTVTGGNEHTGGLGTAYADENTVTFGGALDGGVSKNALASKIKEYIEKRIREVRVSSGVTRSVSEELVSLKALYDSGTLTSGEFERAKAKLLT